MIPRTLDGIRIPCVSLSVNQALIPLSNASMEVLKEDALPIRTYVWISTPNGVTEIYRTRQPQESHTSGYATIQLDHAICEVGDFLIQNAYNEEKTVREAMVTIFSHYRGDKWQLGSFNAPETVILDCDYDNVLETMLAVLEQAPQYYMTFDFSTSPWTVSLAKKSATVTGEGRMSRNIANDSIKYDDKDQCTRVYVKGLPKPSGRESDENAVGYMDADADTIAEYGIIEKETGSGNLTESQATLIAQAYLAAHKLPKRSVELTGDDLTEITGETLDSFICGKKFRLVVPEDNLVIEDYITKVSFQDAINSPSANVIIGDELDAAINFLQAQASRSKSSSRSAKKQDRENETIRTEIYATGSQLYSYVEQTATYIVSVVADVEDGLTSAIAQTASAIRLSVDNSLSDVHSSITATAEQIYSEVHASNSSVYSYINQTATSIQSVVADVNEGLYSEILQTRSMIRSAVWTANSQIYSYVDQTATYILDHVGERTGAKVYTGMEEPIDSPDNPITPGDLWLDGNYVNFWDDADFQYVNYDPDAPDYDWTQLRGAQLKVWKDGKWQLAEDGTTMVEDTDLRRTKDQINLVAYNLQQMDGQLRSNIARLDVRADRITSTVNERIADVGSQISQTAYQIRAEVHSANSQLYSAIEQTATYIRSYVVDKINDVGSEILQTASQIRSEVHAANSQLYSYIDQTATYIQSVVADEVGGLSSSITQTASAIRLEVTDKIGQVNSNITQTARQIRSEVTAANSLIYSSITQTASSIRLEVGNAISGVNSSITQTASQIRSEVNAAKSALSSSITQTASAIRLEVKNAISGVNSSITQTASSIRSEVNAAKSSLSSSITQTASAIRLEVKNATSNLQSQITQNADNIELKVSKDGVVSSINQTSETITINASKINLSGYVKASDLTSTYISGQLANFQSITSERGGISVYSVGTTSYTQGGVSCYVPHAISSLQIVQSGNTYKLQRKRFSENDWVDVGSFSRATSLSGSWSGNTYTVTASPQGDTLSVIPYVHYLTGETATVGAKVGTFSGGSWTDHGSSTNAYLIKDNGYVKLRSQNSASGGMTYGQIQAGCTDIYLDGWTGTYSGDSSTRYTILSGSGTNAVLAMSFTVKSNDGYEEEQIWNDANGNGANKPVTMAYRNGYSDGQSSVSHTPTIDQVWTSSSIPSGASELRSIKTRYEQAKGDGDNFCIRVKCGGNTKTYYCTP